MPDLLRRGSLVLRADPRRVVAKLFLPGQETLANGLSRAEAVIGRVLAMTDEQVTDTLTEMLELFSDRHDGLTEILENHCALVAHRFPDPAAEVSTDRRLLVGAYFTQEYSVESAALFNPSMVPHPDQSDLAPGELRFVMSVRAVGEGHISSIEFRTGVLTGRDGVQMDEPGRYAVAGKPRPRRLSRDYVAAALAEQTDAARAGQVVRMLPAEFEPADFERVAEWVNRDRLTRGSDAVIIDRIRRIMACNYQVDFPATRPLAERVLFPYSPVESHGVEDARFTRFVDGDQATYYGTYTAFDGVNIAPNLLRTDDFDHFEVTQLIGPAAKNKGMAIFPRRVGGQFLALSRWDRESIGIATSPDGAVWGDAVTVQTPQQPWEVIQLGNCGPPIETEAGWLVLNHGVGPIRRYAIGAVLLDLDDPTILLGALTEPLLTPNADERDGYVPNVVYSCGALLHDETLVIPYGCSDSSIRIAYVDVPQLLERLQA
ncbi:MAG TPA: glycoside hydrolase family 130 protein [Propionibacteriaceae bacterium]